MKFTVYRFLSGILLALVLAPSCKTPGPASEVRDTVVEWDNLRMRLGIAYDRRKFKVLTDANCVQGQEEHEKGQTSARVEKQIRFVTNREELAQALGVSAELQLAASVAAAGSGTAKSKIMNNIDFSSEKETVYAIAHIKVSHGKVYLDKAKINPEYDEYITEHFANPSREEEVNDETKAEMRRYMKEFLGVCGTSFLSAYETGGELFGVIKAEKFTSSEKRNLQTEFSASGGGSRGVYDVEASGGATTSSSRTQDRSFAQTDVTFYKIGGTAESDVDVGVGMANLSQFLQAARAFPGQVASGGAVPITARFNNYWELLRTTANLPRWLISELSAHNRELAALAGQSLKLQTAKDLWLKIKKTPAEYSFSRATVERNLSRLADIERQIGERVRGCYRLDSETCKKLDLDLETFQIPTLYQVNITTKTTYNGIKDGYFFTGWPDCFIRVEVAKSARAKGHQIYRTPLKTGYCDLDERISLKKSAIASSVERWGDSANVDDLWLTLEVVEVDPGPKEYSYGKIAAPLKQVLDSNYISRAISNDHLQMEIEFRRIDEN